MAVLEERAKQDAKWGTQNHDFLTWLAIFMEEVGEASKAFMDNSLSPSKELRDNFKNELIQTAAVSVAILECGYRNGWFEKQQ